MARGMNAACLLVCVKSRKRDRDRGGWKMYLEYPDLAACFR